MTQRTIQECRPSPEAIEAAEKACAGLIDMYCDTVADYIRQKAIKETLVDNIARAFDARDAAKVPDGYVLVPGEPTVEMLKAGLGNIGKWPCNADGSVSVREQLKSDYTAMIAAAPKAGGLDECVLQRMGSLSRAVVA